MSQELGDYIQNSDNVKKLEQRAGYKYGREGVLNRQRIADIESGKILVGPVRKTQWFSAEKLTHAGFVGLYKKPKIGENK